MNEIENKNELLDIKFEIRELANKITGLEKQIYRLNEILAPICKIDKIKTIFNIMKKNIGN